jgi:phosphonopyruvate decarboxylase
MIETNEFYNLLTKNKIDFFTGVPDSLLKDFCAYLADNTAKENNIIAANEGNAIALAAGYHLATQKTGLVYMQNSGIGNAVNPLISLADKEVYSIPILLLIGWRGEPGKKDEPQHIKQGKTTISMLEAMGIKYEILPDSFEDGKKTVNNAIRYMKENNQPFALIIKKGTFSPYKIKNKIENNYPLTREEAIKITIDNIDRNSIIVSTTGKASRELFEYRKEIGDIHNKDFLTVGSMGHASQIALAISLQKKKKQIFCIDGDGAAIMHLGGLGIIGNNAKDNFHHILLNNGSHESVGAQPTVAFSINLKNIALSCGYESAYSVSTKEELIEKIDIIKNAKGPSLIEVLVNTKSREDLGRPTTTPIQNKNNFMDFLKG